MFRVPIQQRIVVSARRGPMAQPPTIMSSGVPPADHSIEATEL
jgi:hypothetical protein